jgi:hypothetical protein
MPTDKSPPENPYGDPALRGFQQREIEHAAAQQGLTPEEYGLYRGNYPGPISPVQSATAILVIACFITLIAVFIGARCVLGMATGSSPGLAVIALALGMWIPVYFVWRSFRIQRRAEKLRRARGLAISEPTEDDLQRPVPGFYSWIDPSLRRRPKD